MKRLPPLMLCVLLVTPVMGVALVIGDDTPAVKRQPVPATDPVETAEKADEQPTTATKQLPEKPDAKKPNAKKPATFYPFGTENPFDQKAKAKPGVDDDPFGGDPFGTNPFDAPARTGAAARKLLTPKPPAPKPPAAGYRPPLISSAPTSPARQRIEAALARDTKFDYLDIPLRDVMEDVAFQTDIPIVINVRALDEMGIGTDTPMTIAVGGVSLRSALRLMLSQLDLSYTIEDEVLQITTPERAESALHSRLYRVSRLVPPDRDGAYLVELITKHVAPDSWSEVGGPGAITYIEHIETLAISQTEDVLHQVHALLSSVAQIAEEARSP